VRRSWEAIRPCSTGGNYVKFQVADDTPARTAEATSTFQSIPLLRQYGECACRSHRSGLVGWRRRCCQ
jgi:hypothetical protein